MQLKKKIRIGVIGGSKPDTRSRQVAFNVGQLIAEKGAILICGGLSGVMEAASRGAKQAGGLTIGILPGNSPQDANPNIDIQAEVPRVEFKDIISKVEGESSTEIRKRVIEAKERQLLRFKGKKIYCNSQMGTREVKKYCQVDDQGKELLEMAVNRLGFSARAYARVLKVARTIADLNNEESISPVHVSEAIQYRMMDKYF